MRVILLLVFLSTSTLAGEFSAPDPAAVIEAGKASVEKLRTTPATWTVTIPFGSKASLSAEVIQAPGDRRIIYRAAFPDGSQELARVIETPSAWYVVEGALSRKYRPWEAHLTLPLLNLLRADTDLRFVTDASQLPTFRRRDGNIAWYAIPLPASARNVFAQYEKAVQPKLQGDHPDPKVQQKLAEMRKALEDGIPCAIDVSSGMFTQAGSRAGTVTISGFHYLAAPPARVFDHDQRKWEDFTVDPTVGNISNIATFYSNPMWDPGDPEGLGTGVLVNLVNGQTRRLPFQGPECVAGCFAKDRMGVIVTGEDRIDGSRPLYLIDLKTGVNRRLGGDTYSKGTAMMPCLSPDGKRCAANYSDPSGKLTDFQVLIFDLATGQAMPLGKPFEGGLPSWISDSRLIVTRRPDDKDRVRLAEVCSMDMNGTITLLFRGSSAKAIPQRKSIIFQNARDEWHVCDLDGAHPVMIGNGFAEYSNASPSPDGTRLLMASRKPGPSSPPVIVDISTGKSHPVPLGHGLWTLPSWQ